MVEGPPSYFLPSPGGENDTFNGFLEENSTSVSFVPIAYNCPSVWLGGWQMNLPDFFGGGPDTGLTPDVFASIANGKPPTTGPGSPARCLSPRSRRTGP